MRSTSTRKALPASPSCLEVETLRDDVCQPYADAGNPVPLAVKPEAVSLERWLALCG